MWGRTMKNHDSLCLIVLPSIILPNSIGMDEQCSFWVWAENIDLKREMGGRQTVAARSRMAVLIPASFIQRMTPAQWCQRFQLFPRFQPAARLGRDQTDVTDRSRLSPGR